MSIFFLLPACLFPAETLRDAAALAARHPVPHPILSEGGENPEEGGGERRFSRAAS